MVGGIQTFVAWAKIKRRWNQRASQSGFQFPKTRQNFRSHAEEVESLEVIWTHSILGKRRFLIQIGSREGAQPWPGKNKSPLFHGQKLSQAKTRQYDTETYANSFCYELLRLANGLSEGSLQCWLIERTYRVYLPKSSKCVSVWWIKIATIPKLKESRREGRSWWKGFVLGLKAGE